MPAAALEWDDAPELHGWPEPPPTTRHVLAEQYKTLWTFMHQAKRKAHDEIRQYEKARWYLCRYGNQDWFKVGEMTLIDIEMGMRHLTDWIELETPRSPTGAGPGTSW